MTNKKKWTLIVVLLITLHGIYAQQNDQIPAVYSRFSYDEDGSLYLQVKDNTYYAAASEPFYSLEQVYGNPVGTVTGLVFDLGDTDYRMRRA